jgi:hypothetical protein
MIECINCQKPNPTTCNECGFEYCDICFQDPLLHEPCSLSKNADEKDDIPTNRDLTCSICKEIITGSVICCHCTNHNHELCHECWIVRACAICSEGAACFKPILVFDCICGFTHCKTCKCMNIIFK